MKRRTALGIVGVASALSPATVADALRESAAEAFEYTQQRCATAVGSGTLEQLTATIAELDSAYGLQPATELFPIARGYRKHVESLIEGQHTLTELRELYVHGAYLSHILADLAYDLGSTLTARTFAIDSYQLASEAGHAELCAWAADTHACAMRDTRFPAEATSAAIDGLSRVPRRHPLAARLWARAAQGYAAKATKRRALKRSPMLGPSAMAYRTKCPAASPPTAPNTSRTPSPRTRRNASSDWAPGKKPNTRPERRPEYTSGLLSAPPRQNSTWALPWPTSVRSTKPPNTADTPSLSAKITARPCTGLKPAGSTPCSPADTLRNRER